MKGRAHPRKIQSTGCLHDSAGRLRRGGGSVGCGHGVPQVRASSKLEFGALQVVACEWQGHFVAESLVVLYWVVTPEIRRGRRAARSTTNQESAEPLCAKIKSANREVYEEKADL